jgi:hypothetical protein
MGRQLERRICRLEALCSAAPADSSPGLIICEVGETIEAAILRTCGPSGLPPRPPEAGPNLIIVPVRPTPTISGLSVELEQLRTRCGIQ